MWIECGLTLAACVVAAGVSLWASRQSRSAQLSCWRAANRCDLYHGATLHLVAHQDFAIEDLIELKRADMEVRTDASQPQTIPAVAGDSDPQVPPRSARVAAGA